MFITVAGVIVIAVCSVCYKHRLVISDVLTGMDRGITMSMTEDQYTIYSNSKSQCSRCWHNHTYPNGLSCQCECHDERVLFKWRIRYQGGSTSDPLPPNTWCPICPKCKQAVPTNHSKCDCSDHKLGNPSDFPL